MDYSEITTTKFNALKNKSDTIILGIESSCDETCASVVRGGREVLSSVIASQIDIQKRFGGVVPEVASRNHTLSINNVIDEALQKANLDFSDIDAIGVTYGAGLLGALLVGVSAAKALSYSLNIPLIKVNHIQSHIAANYIEHKNLEPPFLAVVASGGHTSIIEVKEYNSFCVLGGTADDAIGEAFDKVARMLGLPYPGGPEIEQKAKDGTANIEFFKKSNIINSANKNLVLSYSGLKTAVVNYIHNLQQKGERIPVEDICASFSLHAVNLLVNAAVFASKKYGYNRIVLAGGVAANQTLKKTLVSEAFKAGVEVLYPRMELCTDNAAMVAARAYFSAFSGLDLADLSLNAQSVL